MTDRPDITPKAVEAISQLTNHQQQLDADGVLVGVSRQALDETLAAFTAQAARIAELEAASAWQPIETAPKDGEILIWVNIGSGYPVSSQWSDKKRHWTAPFFNDGYPSVTHWQPLPSPPTHQPDTTVQLGCEE